MQVEGKTALVTGASSGLGRHFARLLAREGARVVVAARRLDALAALADEIGGQGGTCIPVAMDVTDPEAVATAFRQIERELADLSRSSSTMQASPRPVRRSTSMPPNGRR